VQLPSFSIFKFMNIINKIYLILKSNIKPFFRLFIVVLLTIFAASFFDGIFSGLNFQLSEFGLVKKEIDILPLIYFYLLFIHLTALYQINPKTQIILFLLCFLYLQFLARFTTKLSFWFSFLFFCDGLSLFKIYPFIYKKI
jgi:hypothetical protein